MPKRRVSLFGYGLTTKPLSKHIQNAVYYDDRCQEPYAGVNGSFVRPTQEFDPKHSDIEITSPGINPRHPLTFNAKNLISEYDFFKDVNNLSIWISGTNGKTTTTQMMQHLLSDKGSQEGGNIGTPLANLDQKAPIWILETSSYTLHYTQEATPNIYVLLPLSPDHLSWHGSLEEYEKAKLKPLSMMRSVDTAIIPAKYKHIKTQAKLITYKDEEELAQIFDINAKKVKFEGAFLLDALLAMAVDKLLFKRVSYEKINSFKLDVHRQEELRDAKGRLWVNDTKATNVDATLAALKRYDGEGFIHLILGGDDKGVDLKSLFTFLQNRAFHIYNTGTNKERLKEFALEYGIAFTQCKNLIDAIEKIDKNLQKDEIALLSPAASSLDEFFSFERRGDDFKEAVASL